MFSFQLAFWLSFALCGHAFNKTSKRGIAFSAADTPGDLINVNQTKSQINWVYDWSNYPADYLGQSHLEFIPMQWGSGAIELFQDAVLKQDAKTVLVFNEPDYENQSKMGAADAARLWMEYIQPLKAKGIRLGGPAVTASATGGPWLQAFFAACKGCTIDFLPLHWYGEGTGGLFDYLWTMHGLYPHLPIWVTEFASISKNETEVVSFINASITYMDGIDWIERYAWFGYFRPKGDQTSNLLDSNGGLTVLGQTYAEVQTVHTQVITMPPTKSYKTVNGADNPNQPLITTYPAFVWQGKMINGTPGLSGFLGTVRRAAFFTGILWILEIHLLY